MAAPILPTAVAHPAGYAGLELLATAVVILDGGYVVRYTNPAAENLLGAGARSLVGQRFPVLFSDSVALEGMLAEALAVHWSYRAQTVNYERPGREALPLSCVVTPIDAPRNATAGRTAADPGATSAGARGAPA